VVYVDELRDWGWRLGPSCHMVADGEPELHAFARAIGLRPEWMQRDARGVHYDLTARRRALAVRRGAREVTSRELAARMARARPQSK
jgi:hypothetical protein